MNIIWARSLSAVAALTISAVIVSALGYTQIALVGSCLILLAMLFFHIWHIQKLWCLLETPDAIEDAQGVWGEVHYRLQRMIKNWHTQKTALSEQHTSFIQAIQASPNGVLMLGANNQIEWCNEMIEEHFALTFGQDHHQRITHLVRRPDFVRYLTLGEFEEPLRLREMGRQHCSAISVQVFPYGGNRKLLLTQDITKLENTEAMRRDFVANVSHELKTPLTVLRGFLETVRDLPLSENERNRSLDTMLSQSLRMQQIVEDLLVLARLEANLRIPTYEQVGMSRIMRHLLHDAKLISNSKHTITLEVDESLDILGCEIELLSAFNNLMTNALRYTPPEGTIALRFYAEKNTERQQGTEQTHAVFSVTDSGIGIDAEHIPRLTERFYRVDRGRSRDTGGTGLGLAIVKHVLSRHHADLLVQSEVNKGSSFTIRFPADRTITVDTSKEAKI